MRGSSAKLRNAAVHCDTLRSEAPARPASLRRTLARESATAWSPRAAKPARRGYRVETSRVVLCLVLVNGAADLFQFGGAWARLVEQPGHESTGGAFEHAAKHIV